MKYACSMAAAIILAAAPTAAQTPAACCAITDIQTTTGVVSGKVSATGSVFKFKVADQRTLAGLRVGQGVFANFTTRRVSLDGRRTCCAITSGPTAPSTARASAPQVKPAAPATAVMPATTATLIESVSISIPRLGSMPQIRAGGRITFTGGREVTVTVKLKAVASTTVGLTVTTSHPSLVQAPTAIPVSAGSSEETFHVLTRAVSTATPVSLTLTRSPDDAKTVDFTIIPTSLTRLELTKTSLIGGDSLVAKVYFAGPPPAGSPVLVQLASSDMSVVPASGSLTLSPDRTVAERILASRGQAEPKQVTITASYGGKSVSGQVNVAPAELAPWTSNPHVINAEPIRVYVRLTGAAPAGGATVQLTSSKPQAYPVPASRTVPAGGRFDSVVVDVPPTTTTGTAVITGTYRGKKQSVTIGVLYDLTVTKLSFTDRFNNAITRPPDAQPFNLCVQVDRGGIGMGPASLPVGITYATSTGTGRTFDIQAAFAHSMHWHAVGCTTLPGLQPGQSHQVTATADPRNQISEGREDNNTLKGSISR